MQIHTERKLISGFQSLGEGVYGGIANGYGFLLG